MSTKCKLKAAAQAAGHMTYISGTPCKLGHGFERRTKGGSCTECLRIKRRESYARNPHQAEKAKLDMRALRVRDPRGVRQRAVRSTMLRMYGITEQAYQALFDKQGGCCAICDALIVSRLDDTRKLYTGRGAPDRYVGRVDHCHETNFVRGLLCSECNIGLGKFRDNEYFLLQAVGYLRASATQQSSGRSQNENLQSEIEPGNRDLDSSHAAEDGKVSSIPLFL